MSFNKNYFDLIESYRNDTKLIKFSFLSFCELIDEIDLSAKQEIERKYSAYEFIKYFFQQTTLLKVIFEIIYFVCTISAIIMSVAQCLFILYVLLKGVINEKPVLVDHETFFSFIFHLFAIYYFLLRFISWCSLYYVYCVHYLMVRQIVISSHEITKLNDQKTNVRIEKLIHLSTRLGNNLVQYFLEEELPQTKRTNKMNKNFESDQNYFKNFAQSFKFFDLAKNYIINSSHQKKNIYMSIFFYTVFLLSFYHSISERSFLSPDEHNAFVYLVFMAPFIDCVFEYTS